MKVHSYFRDLKNTYNTVCRAIKSIPRLYYYGTFPLMM